eukprot:s2225_g11.t1
MIFGQSAGAGSISSHVAMPRSAGLFSVALMQSGGFGGWSAQHMQKEYWFHQFRNRTSCHDVQNVQCMVDLPAEEVLTSYLSLPGRCCGNFFADPRVQWAPAIDGDHQLSTPEFLKLFEKKFQASEAQAKLYKSESHVAVSGYDEGWWSAARVVTDQMFYCTSHLARRLLARQGASAVFGYLLEHSSTGPVVSHNTDLPFVFMNLTEHASPEDWGNSGK